MTPSKYFSILTILALTTLLAIGFIGTASAQNFDDMTSAHQDCATCHESANVTAPVSINYSSEQCAQCHDEAMAGWEESGHTGWGHYPEEYTLDDMAPYETSCSCHFTEGAVWDLKTSESVLDTNNFNPFVQPTTVQQNDLNPGVDCAGCHDPHTGEVRVTGSELCGSCHNGQGTDAQFDVTTGFESHHPNHVNWEQWTGETFDWSDASMFEAGTHSTANVEANCTTCHNAHTFEFSPEAVVNSDKCGTCHTSASEFNTTVTDSMTEFEQNYDEVYTQMEDVADEMGVDIHGGATDHPRDMTAAYQEEYVKLNKAVFYLEFVTGEGSIPSGAMAIHNGEFGTQLVTEAQTLLDEIEVPEDSSPQLSLSVVTGQSDRKAGEEIVVKATYDNNPIEGVEVSVGDQTATTGKDGTATLTFAESGQYDITASKDRWTSATTAVTIVETYEGQISNSLSGIQTTLTSVQDSVSSVQDSVSSVQDSVSGLSDQVSTIVDEKISGLESTINTTMYLAALALIAVLVVLGMMFMRS